MVLHSTLRIQIKIRKLTANTYFGKQIKDASSSIPYTSYLVFLCECCSITSNLSTIVTEIFH